MTHWKRGAGALLMLIVLAGPALIGRPVHADSGATRTFAETGKTVSGAFLDYWTAHGGLAQQGLPLSKEISEVSDLNGQPYTVQYFERAVFEKHPENATPFDILLGQLGTFRYHQKYPAGAPNQHASTAPDARLLPETGRHLGGPFLDYWTTHGGLLQQGYPVSEEFTEVSALDGRPYTVQYFERAVFEYHPDASAPSAGNGSANRVLLSQLGTFRYQAKYAAAQPPATLPAPVAGSLPGSVALENRGPAPDFTGITAWINSGPLTIKQLRGQVVLVEFWTFACINCIHVQPYVKDWYARYKDSGFTVVGVHTPELSFERDLGNVRKAVQDASLAYPVAFDPQFATWNAYNNGYWPAFYYVDKAGQIRYMHIGEGNYDGQEQVIRELLLEPTR